ncbi:response regulator transcription factor [Trujillonella humicola]|uniref:response regulator transcription factor n=1 Tax=Trujillonella humicola TaxID=3383699 RepID=UPI003905CCB8
MAEELVLSERTVESHVRNVLAKLGAANRTELATLVGASHIPPAVDARPSGHLWTGR